MKVLILVPEAANMRWPGRSSAARASRRSSARPATAAWPRLPAAFPSTSRPRRHGPPRRAEQPDLTIVGPELPLSLGIVDELQQRGLRVFGPTRAAAMLESSKGFAKRFLQRHNIPTPNYAVCSSPAEVEKAIEIFHPPIVVKADGLAAGKGVIICESRHTAAEAAQGLFTGALLGEPSSRSSSRSSSKATRSASSA
jgi:glutathione synthase/RimK-type ligase-like ATP-grasp enzyme